MLQQPAASVTSYDFPDIFLAFGIDPFGSWAFCIWSLTFFDYYSIFWPLQGWFWQSLALRRRGRLMMLDLDLRSQLELSLRKQLNDWKRELCISLGYIIYIISQVIAMEERSQRVRVESSSAAWEPKRTRDTEPEILTWHVYIYIYTVIYCYILYVDTEVADLQRLNLRQMTVSTGALEGETLLGGRNVHQGQRVAKSCRRVLSFASKPRQVGGVPSAARSTSPTAFGPCILCCGFWPSCWLTVRGAELGTTGLSLDDLDNFANEKLKVLRLSHSL